MPAKLMLAVRILQFCIMKGEWICMAPSKPTWHPPCKVLGGSEAIPFTRIRWVIGQIFSNTPVESWTQATPRRSLRWLGSSKES